MSNLNDGGPAFPLGPYEVTEGIETLPQHGMTMRDWFAGQAMCGLLSANAFYRGSTSNRGELAADAYAFADAMLETREGVST